MSSGLVAGFFLAIGVCSTIPMVMTLPYRHKAPLGVRLLVYGVLGLGLIAVLLGIAMLQEVAA